MQTRPWVQAAMAVAPMLAPASSYSLHTLPSEPSAALPSASMSCRGCVTFVSPVLTGRQGCGGGELVHKAGRLAVDVKAVRLQLAPAQHQRSGLNASSSQ